MNSPIVRPARSTRGAAPRVGRVGCTIGEFIESFLLEIPSRASPARGVTRDSAPAPLARSRRDSQVLRIATAALVSSTRNVNDSVR